jgi:hypothetical protein
MTYLELCKRTNSIVGFQGVISSVTATGYQETLTTAVRDAFEDIQRYRSDWDWMKATRDINVGSSSNSYTLTTLWAGSTVDLSEYRYILYDYKEMREYWYDDYQTVEWTNSGKPRYYAVEPNGKDLVISPVDATYTLQLHYMLTLQELSANGDIPRLPLRHHQLIIYMAIMKLSTFIGNATLYDTYSVKAAEGLGQLLREENPGKEIRKRPLA